MSILNQYTVNEEALILNKAGEIPLTWWTVAPNFGDLLSPYIFEKLGKRPISLVKVSTTAKKDALKRRTYIAVGSILSRAQDTSIAWGTGSFGTEQASQISSRCDYRAARGPLTRALIKNQKGSCPEVYGDPALIMPLLYHPPVEKKYDVGFVVRWSDDHFKSAKFDEGVKVIDLGRSDIEAVIQEMLACRTIATSSLHGLIIADTYGIPNAWIHSETPKGGDFKFYDYFISVNKIRKSFKAPIYDQVITPHLFHSNMEFDDRAIEFNPESLLDVCPLLKKSPGRV